MPLFFIPDNSQKGIHWTFNFPKVIGVAVVLAFVSIGLRAQQCTLPSRIFLPTADEVMFEQFGQAIDVDDQYMVAGLWENSSHQPLAGRAFVYKLDNDNKWTKIAELTPSDPIKWGNFGTRVAIQGNSIVIYATDYNNEGMWRGKLYVFEKDDGQEWVSGTEDYVIIKPFGAILDRTGYGEFELYENQLITIGFEHSKPYIEVYTKSGGIFTLSQSIETPKSFSGYDNYEWHLAVGDNFLAISSEQHELADRSNGVAYVYPKNVAYTTTPVVLKSSEQTPTSHRGFGLSIAAYESTLVISGIKPHNETFNQSIYIFERPASGWVNASQPYMLESSGYVYYDTQLEANENYIFSNSADYKSIVGFKKPASGWSSAATRFILDDMNGEGSLVGAQIKATDNHLVIGCGSRFLFNGIPEESLVDYYSSTGHFETVGQYQQKILETTINATFDFFGESFSVYNDQLAITASGDDAAAVDAGVVYIFDTQNQSTVPDQKIYNPENENYTGFGQSIAMGEGVMFIGAPFKDTVGSDGVVKHYNIGKVYIYRQTSSGWKYSSQIIAPSIQSETTFGQQVVWSPGYCAVTEFYTGSSESVGRVHIYKENTSNGKFEYIATLDPETHLRSDYFGQSMVMTDSMMVIGTGNFAPNASYRTSVYIFKKKGEWKNATEDARLRASDSGWSDRFGRSVSMYGDYIVVGAPYSPGFDNRPIPRSYIIPGAVYIFKKPAGGWKGVLTETAKLTPSDPMEFGTFGTSVAIDHNDIFIGSPNVYAQYNVTDKFVDTDNSLFPGKVYHFKKPAGGWTTTNQETRQIYSFEPEKIDGYGASLFVSNRYLYVGAMLDDTQSGFSTGSVQTMMQLPIIDEPPLLCSDQPAVKLLGFPKNYGHWSGRGIDASGTFSPEVAGPGFHTISYERSGCTTSVQVEVMASLMTITEKSDDIQTKCTGKSIPITFDSSEDPTNYSWYFKETLDGQLSKIDSLKETITAPKPGYYEVRVKREICPMRTYTFSVLDEDPVPIEFDPLSSVCDDNEMQLSATPSEGQWTGPGISSNGNFKPTGLQDGSYKELYNIVTSIGCHWKDSIIVIVDKLVQPGIQYNGEDICGDKPALLQLTNVDNRTSIKWFDTHGSEINGQNGLSLAVLKAGEYYSEVTKSTCSLNTALVKVNAVVDSLFVPNVFTANNDAVNDYFEVVSEGIDDFHIYLLNRYGQVIFETTDPTFKWNAENVPSGVYYWKISYVTCSNVGKEEKGWVNVIK